MTEFCSYHIVRICKLFYLEGSLWWMGLIQNDPWREAADMSQNHIRTELGITPLHASETRSANDKWTLKYMLPSKRMWPPAVTLSVTKEQPHSSHPHNNLSERNSKAITELRDWRVKDQHEFHLCKNMHSCRHGHQVTQICSTIAKMHEWEDLLLDLHDLEAL